MSKSADIASEHVNQTTEPKWLVGIAVVDVAIRDAERRGLERAATLLAERHYFGLAAEVRALKSKVEND